MKITETKESIKVISEEVLIGKKCDICGKDIVCMNRPSGVPSFDHYNYFIITTHHNDWGRDSADSYTTMDACSSECAIKFATAYINDSYDSVFNSNVIQIEHVRTLRGGNE